MNTPIENAAGLYDAHRQIITTTLSSGKIINHPVYLMGGGQIHKKYFLEAIGDKKYNNAYEWCAGHGEIGFELLTNNICKTLAFSDIYSESTNWCLTNAKDLGYESVVHAYTSPEISQLPKAEPWDLVVGNPPNSLGIDKRVVEQSKVENWPDAMLQLFWRTTWDVDFVVHREFFQNIKNYTTLDVDIFITVHNTMIRYLVENIITPMGFDLVQVYDMFPDDPGLKVAKIKRIG